jgi:hypothetical protein
LLSSISRLNGAEANEVNILNGVEINRVNNLRGKITNNMSQNRAKSTGVVRIPSPRTFQESDSFRESAVVGAFLNTRSE